MSISSAVVPDERVMFDASAGPLPLVARPSGAAVELAEWAHAQRHEIERALRRHGAILFRGFCDGDGSHLQSFTRAIELEMMEYIERATPRTHLGAHVYTSTEFPPEHAIALHNELSYVMTWPMRILFFCVTAPADRGETPIADMRRVYRRLPASVRERFEDKGWMLVRNFGEGLGPTWQESFATDERAVVERYAAQARIALDWRDERRLRTTQVRPAVTRHPDTGEPVWFNHVAFWHASSLDPEFRQLLLEEYGEERLPYNTYYGDGTRIDDATVEALRAAYDAETVATPWQQGDLLLLDNMLVAHGRRPFSGARKIIVSMGRPYTRPEP